MSNKTISIYSYTDHQLYLKDWISWCKEIGKPSSLQALSKQLGLKSRSYLQKVLQDTSKPLSEEVLERIISLIGLSSTESDYFRAMVAFSRARTLSEKDACFSRMHQIMARRQTSTIEGAKYDFFGAWYMPVLREVACLKDWKGDYQSMGAFLDPPLTEFQTKKGIELLLKLGLIQQAGTTFNPTDFHVKAEPNVHPMMVAKYHQVILEQASKAIEVQSLEEREYGVITMAVPSPFIPRLKELIHDFQQRVLNEIHEEWTAEHVYVMSMQLFRATSNKTSNNRGER